MVVINKDTGICYENLNQRQVANIVNVNRNTVRRWRRSVKIKEVGDYVIYLFTFDIKT